MYKIITPDSEKTFSLCDVIIDNFSTFASEYTDLIDKEHCKNLLKLLSEEGVVLVAISEDESEIYGIIGGGIQPFLFNPSIEMLSESFWWVNDDFRNYGVGKSLLEEFEREGRDRGVSIVSMSVLSGNTPEGVERFLVDQDYLEYEKAYIKRL